MQRQEQRSERKQKAEAEKQAKKEQAEVAKYNNEYTKKHGKRSVNFLEKM